MNIISTIVDALTEMLTGSVAAISEGVSALFTTEGGGLSVLGTILMTFMGLGFAVGLVYVIINLVRR